MKRIKIVFLDGCEMEMEVGKNTFSQVCVMAAYNRLQTGAKTHKELTINEKACFIASTKNRKFIDKEKEKQAERIARRMGWID